MIGTKRIFDEAERDEGLRILVDRLWPRGMTKKRARIDKWARDLAPSSELRKWYGHNPAHWEAFTERYREELRKNRPAVARLIEEIGRQNATLLFAAKDLEHNNAVVLKRFIEDFSNT